MRSSSVTGQSLNASLWSSSIDTRRPWDLITCLCWGLYCFTTLLQCHFPLPKNQCAGTFLYSVYKTEQSTPLILIIETKRSLTIMVPLFVQFFPLFSAVLSVFPPFYWRGKIRSPPFFSSYQSYVKHSLTFNLDHKQNILESLKTWPVCLQHVKRCC